eukprot:7564454-Karenia_brevis.AAC.1
MDTVLKNNRHKYTGFLADLNRCGLLYWTQSPKEFAAVFFVRKKDERLRMIIDCRRANARFKAPDNVDMCTAEGLARLEVEIEDPDEMLLDGQPAAAIADVENCFHRLRIRKELSEYFCLPPLKARELAKLTAEFKHLSGDEDVFPCVGTLPMGFTWSLYFAQNINEYNMETKGGFLEKDRISDKQEPVHLHRSSAPRHYVYVDNAGIIDVELKDAAEKMKSFCKKMSDVGLSMHEVEITN